MARIGCVDVDYRGAIACAACIVFERWDDEKPSASFTEHVGNVEPYQPGSFYKRELPCLVAVLAKAGDFTTIVIDGYAWLDSQRPGLGAKLFERLDSKTPVIGVSKTLFRGAVAAPVYRGTSKQPLHVTVAGMDIVEAVSAIQSMHGAHRVPTLLKRVDRLCRKA